MYRLKMEGDYYIEIDENSDEKKVNSKIILPSQKEKIKKNSKKKRNNFLAKFKWSMIIILGILLYLFYQPILLSFLSILKLNPTLYADYLYIQAQISNNTLLGLFLAMILGSLFFLALPSEMIFIYFLSSTQFNFILIILFAILGNLVGLLFNYLFGWILGERVVRFIFKKNFWKYKQKIDNYGGWILLFGNIFPGPIEVLSVFYGSFKFNIKNYLFLALIGRTLKFVLLFLAFTFYWDQIINYYHIILDIIWF